MLKLMARERIPPLIIHLQLFKKCLVKILFDSDVWMGRGQNSGNAEARF
jgi:hypothetical protein